MALTVSAGADTQVTPGGVFTRTATESGTPAAPVATRRWTLGAAPATTGDPTVAAERYGWGQPAAADEMTYSGAPNSARWSVYSGAGHDGNGLRSPSQVTVNGSAMVLTGAAGSANTAGLAHKYSQKYGRWEVRCRSSVTGSGGSSVPVGSTTRFTEGFELGNFTRWTSVQTHSYDGSASGYDNTGADYRLRIVSTGTDRPQVLRTEVRDGDTAVGDHERSELSSFGKSWNSPRNNEEWFETDFRLGDPGWSPGWSGSNDWIIIQQWHQQHDDGAPAVAMTVRNDNKVYLELEADGVIQPRRLLWTVRPGQWEKVVTHVKWSPDPAVGFVHVYVNGVEVLAKTFCKTMYTADNTDPYYLKMGQYRRSTVSGATVVMHDNLRVSTTPATTSTVPGNDYHPVLILWPDSDTWPEGGEIDFLEVDTPGAADAEAYWHYPSLDGSNTQLHFTKTGVDLTGWHNFAVEQSTTGLVGYLDGVEWCRASGGATSKRRAIQDPPGPMHLTVQLDAFSPSGMRAGKMEVDWVRAYPIVPQGQTPSSGSGTVGQTIGAAAALSWTAPTVAGTYTLTYAALDAAGVVLASDSVQVVVATTPTTGGGGTPVVTPIILEPVPIPSSEAFGTFELVAETRTVPELPTLPGPTTFPGATTFPRGSLDPRWRRQRTGWTTYPGPGLYPGAGTWPGWGRDTDPPPPFDVEFFLLDGAGRYRCPLPDVKTAALTDVAGDSGSVSLAYPVDGLNFDQLREHVDADTDAVVAARFAGTAEFERQAILSDCSGDDVADSAVWQFTGAWSAALLEEAVVYPDPGTADGKVEFVDATPGQILTDLVGRAQTRGGLDIDTGTFSAAYDSSGQPWPADSISSPTFVPGDSSTYLRVVQQLADAGLCEFEMRGRSLRLYRSGGRGWDRTVGSPVVLQAGRDLLDAGRQHSIRDAVTSLLMLGGDGDWVEVADGAALGRRGRRVEGAASQGSLTGGALRAYGQAKIATSATGKVERVHGLVLVEGSPMPVRDFGVGDRVWSDADGVRRALRVAQWTLALDDQGWSGSVSLGDLIDDPLLKLTRRLLGIGERSTVTGSGKRVEGATPGAPTGLTVTSVTSPRGDGVSEATLLCSWDQVVLAADGVSGVDVTGYRLRWRYTSTTAAGVAVAGEWTVVDEIEGTSHQVEGVVPAAAVEVQVAAYSAVTVTGGGTDPGGSDLAPVLQAVEAILTRIRSGQTYYEDWTWTGAPAVVGEFNDILQAAWKAAGSPSPTVWLQAYLDSGTVPPVTGGGGGGGGSAGGTTVAGILHLGPAGGLSKANLGVDFLPGEGPSGNQGKHVDYDLAKIVAGLGSEVVPKYVQVRSGAVRLTSYVGGATTPNSTHSRTEFRELGADGVAKAAWSSTSGVHYVWCKGAVVKLPAGRKRACIAQVHTPDDDLCMILVDQGTLVESTYGDKGRPGRLTSNLVLGQVYQWAIKLVRESSQTVIEYYWDDMSKPKATQTYAGGAGNYSKWGNYQQSSTATDPVGETCIVDLYDAKAWHTGYPTPTGGHPFPGMT